MARTKRKFVDSGEIRAVAEQLKRRYPELLERVNLEQVYFAFCISERAKNAAAAVIRTAVSNPLPGMVISKPYQIAMYRDDWEAWNDAQKHARVLEQLCYIDEDGKYLKPDVQELYPFVATWGPDWRDDELLPDVLEENVAFERRPEPEDEDDGEDEARTTKKKFADPIAQAIIDEELAKKKALADRAERKVDPEAGAAEDQAAEVGNF